MQTGAASVETRIEVSQTNKSGFALRPRDFTSGNISEETQNTNLKEYMHPYDHCSIIYNCQDMEATQVPVSRRVNKEVVHIYNGTLLGYKKSEILLFARIWMN